MECQSIFFFFIQRLLDLDKSNKKQGLKKTEISNLASFEYKNNSENSNDDKTCSICYDDFKVKEKVMALSCFHKYHQKCISPWLTVSYLLIYKLVFNFFLLF
jgi:hypothetical protein